MTEPKPESWAKRVQTNAVMVAAILFALFTMMGVNSSLQALETRVRVLDESVSELRTVETHIETLQGDVRELAKLRNDILEAIQAATRSDNRRDH